MRQVKAQHREFLSSLAWQSVRHGLDTGEPVAIDPDSTAPELRKHHSCFVTLKHARQLRGCVGSVRAKRALAEEVAVNAYGAAFHDPRFGHLRVEELDGLQIEISILSNPEFLRVSSENELVEKLTPGVDGLILSQGGLQGTFLPAVWEKLPQPQDFIRELKQKAGFASDYWSESMVIERYTTESWIAHR
ncbi:MAG: AmmeMemoRadiSam system protein A [Gammaproteobacteria bacterium]|nr:AmmeMemoRadiSam system protein A [Gammaproteobacteria bacterium]